MRVGKYATFKTRVLTKALVRETVGRLITRYSSFKVKLVFFLRLVFSKTDYTSKK